MSDHPSRVVYLGPNRDILLESGKWEFQFKPIPDFGHIWIKQTQLGNWFGSGDKYEAGYSIRGQTGDIRIERAGKGAKLLRGTWNSHRDKRHGDLDFKISADGREIKGDWWYGEIRHADREKRRRLFNGTLEKGELLVRPSYMWMGLGFQIAGGAGTKGWQEFAALMFKCDDPNDQFVLYGKGPRKGFMLGGGAAIMLVTISCLVKNPRKRMFWVIGPRWDKLSGQVKTVSDWTIDLGPYKVGTAIKVLRKLDKYKNLFELLSRAARIYDSYETYVKNKWTDIRAAIIPFMIDSGLSIAASKPQVKLLEITGAGLELSCYDAKLTLGTLDGMPEIFKTHAQSPYHRPPKWAGRI